MRDTIRTRCASAISPYGPRFMPGLFVHDVNSWRDRGTAQIVVIEILGVRGSRLCITSCL